MPRRYSVRYERARTPEGDEISIPAISIPADDEKYFPPVVYTCERCGRRFYFLKAFVDHITLKHGIPPHLAWRFVEPKEVR